MPGRVDPAGRPALQRRAVQTAEDVLALQEASGNRAAIAVLDAHSARIARQPDTEDAHPDDPRARAERLLEEAKAVNEAATTFQKRATEEMGRVHAGVVEYLATYRRAYDKVSADLGKAGEEAARKEAILGAVVGIVVGTGVGLILPELINGYRKMRLVGLLSTKAVPELSEKEPPSPRRLRERRSSSESGARSAPTRRRGSSSHASSAPTWSTRRSGSSLPRGGKLWPRPPRASRSSETPAMRSSRHCTSRYRATSSARS